MKHIEIVNLSQPDKSLQPEFDLVLEELEERREFSGGILAVDPGGGCCCGCCGYAPRVLHARADTPITLNVVTNRTYSCSRAFVIPALGVEKLLPDSGTETISIPAQTAGTVMRFSCSMGMYTGKIIFDQ
ncbi:MAG: cupredoxin domain-containing protein [Anaerolineales bacterium]|nr:cupredoxin domain-containing protein [Anaerolineales bacterium]